MPIGARRGSLVLPDRGAAALEQLQGLWAYPEKRVVKSVDETVNNSATLQNDDELKITLGANEVWSVEVFVMYVSSGTADFKIGWFYPTGTNIDALIAGWDTAGASYVLPQFSESAAASLQGSSPGTVTARISGVVTTGGTPGVVGLRWSQDVAEVSNTTVLQYSWLRMQRLS